MARTAWRPARGKDDRHGQSGLHLGKPLSPGRGRGDRPDGCPFRTRPRGRELADDYRFAPRQYLILRTTTDGECAPRPTSIFPRSFRILIFGNEGALVAAPICQAITSLQPCPEKFEIRKF